MKVFASWSGVLSHSVAKLFKGFLEDVIQGSEVWLSSDDIQKGSVWPTEIYAALKETDFGILFLTQENMTAPWVLFEAGAISQGLTKSRVTPLLIDITPAGLNSPLSLLNATVLNKTEIKKLIRDINKNSTTQLVDDKLVRAFDKYWPDFESEFQKIIGEKKDNTPVKKRDARELIEEVLEISRSIYREIESKKTAKEWLSGGNQPLSASDSPDLKGGIFSAAWFDHILKLKEIEKEKDAEKVREILLRAAQKSKSHSKPNPDGEEK